MAVATLSDQRPTIIIVRANKLLAHTDSNGYCYRLLVHSNDVVERKMDETTVGVVLDKIPIKQVLRPSFRAHHALLATTVGGHPTSKRCAANAGLIAEEAIGPL
ncbi:MAG: hypothetical protein IM674_01215 [Brevundimonas sp.]|jgi:hypothetical protein|nr:hypothetical protein [Acidobacteriaceae bacterium]MCA3716850.1 hypothetical protein [Brevundimonas sp.]